MSSHHESLVQDLEGVLSRLEAGDAVAAEPLVTELSVRIRSVPDPLGDARVRPLLERCVASAELLRLRLEDELRRAATSNRAVLAYGADP
jgi:hypothetical protein